jgi:Protein of unknown function (DUF3305)
LSPAAAPLLSIRIGVVIERRKADSQWIDFVWRPIAVLPDEPDMKPWTMMREDAESTTYYVGGATIDLYRSETTHYRDNLASGAPGVWVVLSPSDGERPYSIAVVTADPAEGEGYTEAATYLIEEVPMPEAIREVVARFVQEHHVEREFFKRQRGRADPEALARRGHGDREENE